MRARRGRWGALLVAAAAGMAGLGPVLLATAQPAWAFVARVYIDGQAYTPKLTEIDIGDKIIWRNRTDQEHSVTFDSLDWDDELGARGREVERRFNEAGEYTYRCKFHDGMTGTVVVTDPNAPTTTTSTAPPATTTTTTTRPTTTTTAPTTTTTEPPTTTTTVPPRPPAEVPAPPVPTTAAAPAPPPTLATSSTTTVPPTTTTTAAPTTTSAPPAPPAGEQIASPSPAASEPPTTETTAGDTGDQKTAVGRPGGSDGDLDFGAVVLISLLVAVGLFGAWTLIRIRPGRI